MLPTLYDILDVLSTATPDEIKAAHARLAKAYHPDKHKGDDKFEAKFKEVHTAFEVLIDPARRKRYDETGRWSNDANNDDSQVVSYLQTLMHAIIKEMVTKGINPTDRNLLRHMRANLEKLRTNLVNEIRSLSKVRKNLEDVAALMKNKHPDQENLLSKIAVAPIDQEINPCIEQKQKEVKLIKQCLVVINDHKWTGRENPFDFAMPEGGWGSYFLADGTTHRTPEEE